MNLNKIKLLLTLKTCSLYKKETVKIKYNIKNYDLIFILYKEGFIQSFSLNRFEKNNFIYLRYYYNKSLLNSIKIISKPSLNKYLKLKDLYKFNMKKKMFIISTIKGLKTSFDCKLNCIGGKLLFIC